MKIKEIDEIARRCCYEYRLILGDAQKAYTYITGFNDAAEWLANSIWRDRDETPKNLGKREIILMFRDDSYNIILKGLIIGMIFLKFTILLNGLILTIFYLIKNYFGMTGYLKEAFVCILYVQYEKKMMVK